MSSENNVAQVQKWFTEWQGAASEQVGRVVEFWSEVGRTVQAPVGLVDASSALGAAHKVVRESMEQLTQLSQKNTEHTQAVFGELWRLTRTSLSHAAEVTQELSRLQLGALKKSGEVFHKSAAN